LKEFSVTGVPLFVVIDPKKEKNAIREARKLGITTVALIDTDCDPDLVDLPIPGNDDGIRSIERVVHHLADAIAATRAEVEAKSDEEAVAFFQAYFGERARRGLPGRPDAILRRVERERERLFRRFQRRHRPGSTLALPSERWESARLLKNGSADGS